VGNVGSRFKHEVPTSGGRAQGSRMTDGSCRLLFHQFPTEHVTRDCRVRKKPFILQYSVNVFNTS